MYRATIKVESKTSYDGTEMPVFPRGRSAWFRSRQLAERALERHGRRGIHGHGRVYDRSGTIVWTIAL